MMKRLNLLALGAICMIIILVVVNTVTSIIHNQKYNDCINQGKYYTEDKKCLTCQETGRMFINGECIVPDTKPKMLNLNEYLNKNG
jgi:hypothetical protein